jgi:large subunit ribosomal protein L28
MPTRCACGKEITTGGNRIVRRGLPKKKGGIGLHTTGVTPRTFKRNVQTMKVRLPSGEVRRLRVCASCIKANKYTKAK